MTWVTDAKHLGGYRLRVRFSDASEGEIEIRPVLEAEDFGEAYTPELREQEERLRVQAALPK